MFALLLATLPAFAPPGDGPIERYLADDSRAVNAVPLAGAKTLADWQAHLPRLRRDYLDMLGLDPLPEKTPLQAKITGTLTRGEAVIEKLHFQSRPGLYVTANLYRPKTVTKPLPGIVYVCGHSGRGRDGNKTAFQDHGMWFARNGYVCLILDTLQLGEIAGKHHGTYNLGRWWWHSRGYTPAGVECWNGIRAIDYLISRKEVDAQRIGVTGISGGGATTVWIAAADERVKVAVPVSGMSDLESYIHHKVINGHCDCMFVYNLHRWEWSTLAALIAPRPMLFANSDMDPIFPMDGNRRIMAHLRQAYALFGKSDLVAEHVSPGGHDYRPDLRIAIFQWFNKHLRGSTEAIKDADDPPLPGNELRVFATEKEMPPDALNARIDEVFVPLAKVNLPVPGEFASWKADLLGRLKDRVFRNLGEIHAARPGKDKPDARSLLHPVTTAGEVQAYLSSALPGIAAGKERTLIVLDEDEAAGSGVPDWAKTLATSGVVRLLEPRGGRSAPWTRKSPPNYVERAHVLLGRTVDLGRVYDILAVLKLLREEGSWRLIGRGKAGVLVAYAALLDPSVSEVVVVNPTTSHMDGPHLLGVLRVLDIPEALGLLAPRPLRLIEAKGPAFERTLAIYRAAEATDKVSRK